MSDTRPSPRVITLMQLLLFWLPLALMWIIMGVEQPALNGVMARLPDAALHLAAFEVAFGLALVMESPILQMLSAATALVRGKHTYRSTLRFMHVWALGLTALHFTLSRPAIFGWITRELLGVPEAVIEPAREVFTILILFAAMVGYRRLWQGSLIRAGETGLVARTMVIRLIATVAALATGLVLHRTGSSTVVPGHVVGAGSLMLGVIVGAAASWWYYHRTVAPRLNDDDAAVVKSPPELLKFYLPLSLTSVMLLAARPVLAFGIGRSTEPFLSLAAWPVVQSLLFMFTSVALSYQEAVVAKMGDDQDNEETLRRFGWLLAGGLTVLFAVLSFTGGSTVWFARVAGLDAELIALARPAMQVLVLMPLLVTGRSYFSGVLVSRDRTGLLGISVVANTVTLVGLVIILPTVDGLAGTVVAAIAFAGANAAQLVVLWVGDARERRARRLRGASGQGVAESA